MQKLLPENVILRMLLSLVLLVPMTAVASENWYTVEVISFTRAKAGHVNEKWSVPTDVHAGWSEIPSNVPGQLDSIQTVPRKEWKLGPHAYSIGRSGNLRVQSHQSWRQKGLSREQAPWITLASESAQLSGKIRLSLSRYLHVDTDIDLMNPDWSPSPGSQNDRINFKASRRVKRGKLHYIDHPLAGVLVYVERFEESQEQPPESAQENIEVDSTPQPN